MRDVQNQWKSNMVINFIGVHVRYFPKNYQIDYLLFVPKDSEEKNIYVTAIKFLNNTSYRRI